MARLLPDRLVFRAFCAGALALALSSAASHATAQSAPDAATARTHLTQGYQLKRQGRLKEALAHLAESFRLDPQLKTLMNLADCEERLGALVEAQQHWVAARAQALRENQPQLQQEAERRLALLDQRVPHLTIQLAPGAAAEAQVYRDDVLLGRPSLGVPLPTNAGEHTILVRSPGKDDWKYVVRLAERDNQIVTANTGPASKAAPAAAASAATPIAGPAPMSSPPPPPAVAPPPPPPPPAASSGSLALRDEHPPAKGAAPGSTQRTLGLVSGGLGIVSLAVSALYWGKASSDIRAETNAREKAKDDLFVTNVTFVTGAVLVAGGTVLFLTAPKVQKQVGWRVLPSAGLAENRLVLGAFGQF